MDATTIKSRNTIDGAFFYRIVGIILYIFLRTYSYLIKPSELVNGHSGVGVHHLCQAQEWILITLEEQLSHGLVDEDLAPHRLQRGAEAPLHEEVVLHLPAGGLTMQERKRKKT